MAKIYIAAPLCEKKDRELAEKIAKICEDLGFRTFLPHRDVGLYSEIKDIGRIAKQDLKELYSCDAMVGVLNGICVGAGTAWEMGFMQALNKPVLGIKTDRELKKSLSDISVIIAGCVEIASSFEGLKEKIRQLKLI